MQNRINSLVSLTNGNASWYSTHKQITAAEAKAGVVWNGVTMAHELAKPGALMKSNSGSWGRLNHGCSSVSSITAKECKELGLVCGPANN